MLTEVTIALDRASVRRIDQDGHLFVEVANISASCVSPYLGAEIPRWEELGLRADQEYQLLRDPDALAASAKSFCGKPLLLKHRPVSADDHPHDIVVGAIGNDVRFEAPYLKASLSVWDKDSIQAIQNDEIKDISCGYYYVCEMESGDYQGTPYQGRVLQIKGNHAALVPIGRVPGAFVGDAAPATPLETTPEPAVDPAPPPPPPNLRRINLMATRAKPLSRCALYASGATSALLAGKMATDAKMDVNAIFRGVTAKNWKASKPKVVARLNKAVEGKLAQDADIEDVIEMLDQLEDVAEEMEDAPLEVVDPDEPTEEKPADDDGDLISKVKALCDGASEEEIEAVIAALKPAESDAGVPPLTASDDEPKVTKAAMDAAIGRAVAATQRATQQVTEKAVMAKLRAIAEAEKEVRPHIGELAVAQDSAEAVYRLALDHAGVDAGGVPPAAFAAMVRMLPKPGQEVAVKKVVAAVAAMDAAAVTARSERFPNANRLSK